MNTRHAEIILTVLREGSITAAAKVLFVTQPTLSQTIKQIERQFGEPIFVRGRSPLTLTPAGELYASAARRILRIEEQLTASLNGLHDRQSGILRIGVPLHHSDTLIPPVLAEFARACPGVFLQIHEAERSELENLLVQGELDAALMMGESRRNELESRLIVSTELILACGRNTELARQIPSGSTISLNHARNERFALRLSDSTMTRICMAMFDAAGFSPQIALQCDSPSACRRACINANLATLTPLICLACDELSHTALSFYHLGSEAFLPPICLAFLRDDALSAPLEIFYSLICSRYRAMSTYR